MKFLIFGGTGLVGKNLRKLLNADYTFFTSRSISQERNSIVCDILKREDLEKAFKIARPDVVINASNLAGGVDFCENNPEIAEKFHYGATVDIGNLCIENGSKFVFISTDYVFDGTKGPYKEDDETNPLNKYGSYKLKAENWLKANIKDHLIVRTTNVFGWDPETKTPNYLMNVYFKNQKNEEINAPSYLSGNPTHAFNLSQAILELCARGKTGIFHVVGKAYLDRHHWTLKFTEKLRLNNARIKEIKYPPVNIVPRPLMSNLDTAKFEKECATKLMNLDEGMEKFFQEMGGEID